MVCIYCGNKTKVTNSRAQKTNLATWRRRECLKCHSVVTSIENISLEDAIRVEKRNQSLEPFWRDKIYLSICKAIDHLDNSAVTAMFLTNTVLRHLFKASKDINPIIKSDYVSITVSKVLKNYNAAASIKYLSFQSNMQLPNDVRRNLK